IDRALAPERRRLQVKGRSGTKPGSILRSQIPIRTFAEWDDHRPGFCEVDLVAHDGGSPWGEFCQTLDLTCVATGWTEPRAVPNKAQLKRDLVACQERLISASKDKSQGRKEVTHPPGRRLGGYLSKAEASRTSFVMQPETASRTS